MRKLRTVVLASAAAVAAACGRSNPPNDAALQADLALASQAQQLTPQSVSPAEQGLSAQPATTPYRAPTTAVRRTATRRVASAPARRTYPSSSSGDYYPAQSPAPQPTVVKHTGRDAAIGAAAGAVIGATTSRDKVKGEIIGAAAGGILGAVIGNNVDIQRKPQF